MRLALHEQIEWDGALLIHVPFLLPSWQIGAIWVMSRNIFYHVTDNKHNSSLQSFPIFHLWWTSRLPPNFAMLWFACDFLTTKQCLSSKTSCAPSLSSTHPPLTPQIPLSRSPLPADLKLASRQEDAAVENQETRGIYVNLNFSIDDVTFFLDKLINTVTSASIQVQFPL